MKFCLFGLLFLESLGFSSRHIVLLQATAQAIQGSYFFALVNNTPEESHIQTRLFMPQGAQLGLPGEGLLETDLKTEGTTVLINKKVPPGMNLMSLGFKMDRPEGDRLTFVLGEGLSEFSVAANKEAQITLSSHTLTPGVPPMLLQTSFRGVMTSAPTKDGQTVHVDILGLPPSRWPFTLLAWCTFFSMISLLVFSFYKTQLKKGSL
jgi:hypothetical protein